ncbi:MAG: hypothetical protein FJ086_07830, partial [Deltaproteobacteria bacterium]|nr:hypothetical protein [Deltaproteobacteria bacterium]
MIALTLALTLSATPAPALAPEAAERFKALFTEGEELFGRGDAAGAARAFREADRIRQTPEVAWDLARCHEKLREPALVAYYYRQYLRRAPKAQDALEVAETLGNLLEQAEADGQGLLELEGTEPGSVELEAGRMAGGLPQAAFLPPGDYAGQVRFSTGTQTFIASLLTGKVTTLNLAPPAANVAAPAGWAPSADLARVQERGASHRTRRLVHDASLVGLGLGAVGLAVGGTFGVLSQVDRQALANGPGVLTVTEGRALAAQAADRGMLASVLLVASGAVTAAGAAT